MGIRKNSEVVVEMVLGNDGGIKVTLSSVGVELGKLKDVKIEVREENANQGSRTMIEFAGVKESELKEFAELILEALKVKSVPHVAFRDVAFRDGEK